MKLFLICGEKSGDNILSQILEIVEILKQQYHIKQDIEIQSVIFDDTAKKYHTKNIMSAEKFSIFGISNIILHFASLLDNIIDIAYSIYAFKPNLVISIDSYELCIRIIKKTQKLFKKKMNVQNYTQYWHIVAPSVWAYWPNRAKQIAKYYNRLFYLLPFEGQYFKPLERKSTQHNKGFLSSFVGFPAVFQEIDKNIIKDKKLIGFTIGSRKNEIKKHQKLILQTILKLKMMDNDYKFIIFATVNTLPLINETFLGIKNVEIVTNKRDKTKKIQECSIVVAKNGTNNVEIGALNTAMITYYKTSLLTYIFCKIFVKTKLFNLLNICLQYENIPEFLQKNATSQSLAQMVYYFLTHPDEIEKQVLNNKKAINIMQVHNKQQPAELIAHELMYFASQYE